MVEGQGSRRLPHRARRWPISDPALFGRLIRTLVEATAEYLLAQVEAGAEALMLFDSWAGMLPPGAVPPLGDRADGGHRARCCASACRPAIPLIGFPRLAGPLLGGIRAADRACRRWRWTPRWTRAGRRRRWRRTMALQGNLDPLALVAGGMALEAETRAILARCAGRPYVFNLGHGIEQETPPEHVSALVRMVRGG